MIEIMVGVWLTSFLISLPITFFNVRYAYKLARSAKYKRLNQNLEKIGQFWSLSDESFKTEGSAAHDEEKARRSSLYLGALGFLSAFGLLFLIILTVSLQFLVKSRLTRRVFQSELTTNSELTPEQVAQLVTNLKTNSF